MDLLSFGRRHLTDTVTEWKDGHLCMTVETLALLMMIESIAKPVCKLQR